MRKSNAPESDRTWFREIVEELREEARRRARKPVTLGNARNVRVK